MVRPNEHLLAIERVIEHMAERAQYVRLDRNERVQPWSDEVFRDMLACLRPEQLCAYPDPTPLYRRLSQGLAVGDDQLYLTNGSDAAIRMTFQTFLRPGDTVLQADPTYAMYAIYTRIFQGDIQTVSYDRNLHLDVDRLLAELRGRPRILALANPDQPTGATLSQDILRQLAEATRETGSLLLIDEAYYPFFPHTAVSLTREYAHVIVTRTFSKFGGLAGLRLGYLVSSPDVVRQVQRIRGAHEVNAMAIALGAYVLDHPALTHAHQGEIEAGRRILVGTARELALGVPICPTNFQLLRFDGVSDTEPICNALKQRGYLVKGGFKAPSVRDCIRVTLGGPAVMLGFVAALRDVVAARTNLTPGKGPS